MFINESGCDELEERCAHEIIILGMFGFFAQVSPSTYRTYSYVGEIDNERQSSVLITQEGNNRKVDRDKEVDEYDTSGYSENI